MGQFISECQGTDVFFYSFFSIMTSIKVNVIYIASITLLSAVSVSGNNCFNEGTTWNTDGQLDFIPGVTSVQDCVRECFENDNCIGYTWFGDVGGVDITRSKNVCTLFVTLEDEYECSDCISGTKADLDTCICDQMSGQCKIGENNLIAATHSESEFDCFLQCSAIEQCKYYTWFSLENEEVHQECLFFSTCESVESCSNGCYVGGVDCGDGPTPMPTPTTSPPVPTTTPPAPTTTPPAPTTTPPAPTTTTPAPTTTPPTPTPATTTSTTTPRTWNFCDATIEYNVLDDAKRNVENDIGPYYCDRISNDRRFKASPDWKGPGWYRMKSPAGLQLSEEPVLPYHCSTSGTGWLNGPHPDNLGETVGMQVCFSGPSGNDECQWLTSIQVKNCGNFYLYKLEDTPYCPLR